MGEVFSLVKLGLVPVQKGSSQSWQWKSVAAKLQEKGYAVQKTGIKEPKRGELYQQLVVPKELRKNCLVLRASGSGACNKVRPSSSGDYNARVASFGVKYRAANNLMLVTKPEDRTVEVLEFGLRRSSGAMFATAQLLSRKIDDLYYGHGLRKALFEAWPECGVHYDPNYKPEYGVEGQDLPTEPLDLQVLWHSLRLGLVHAETKTGEKLFFWDCLLYRQTDFVKLLRRGQYLEYLPPKAGGAITDSEHDLRVVNRGKLVKKEKPVLELAKQTE